MEFLRGAFSSELKCSNFTFELAGSPEMNNAELIVIRKSGNDIKQIHFYEIKIGTQEDAIRFYNQHTTFYLINI